MTDKFVIGLGQGGPINLVVCVPSIEYWHADFALSLMSMQQLLCTHPLGEDFKHNLINERGALISLQREHLADMAMEEGATHLMWLDSDMKFPPNIVHRLYKHRVPLVACNYVKRKIPAMPNTKTMDNKLIATNPESTGLVEAGSAGFGAMLMERQVLEKTPKPWFDTVWMDKGEKGLEMMGEDVFFCQKVRKLAGIPLLIDHDTSQKVGHIGTFEYTNTLCAATWDEMEGVPYKDEVEAKVMA